MKTKLLILALFFLIVGGLGVPEVESFLLNSRIDSNPSTTTAQVVDHQKYTKSKRGVRTDTYNIQYTFDVNGKVYNNHVSLTNDSGENVLAKGSVDIVYLTSNPSINRLQGGFVSGKTTKDLIWMLIQLFIFSAVMATFLGFILSIKFGWIDLESWKNQDESPVPEKGSA